MKMDFIFHFSQFNFGGFQPFSISTPFECREAMFFSKWQLS